MEISVKTQQQSKVEITGVFQTDEFNRYRDKALTENGARITLEGFRQGKAPLERVQQAVGQEAILTEAARLAITDAYTKAIAEHKLDVVGEPAVVVKKLAPGNPFEFQLTVAVIPAITLPDYKKLASQIQPKEVAVTEEEIQETLRHLRESRKKEDGSLPELTDEFAKTLGHFETIEEVKEGLRSGLLQEKQFQEIQRVRQEILETISSKAKGELPDILVSQEKQSMLENIRYGVKETLQMEFADYLQKINKTEEELLETLAKDAEKRVKNSLVLREITKQEQLHATPDEIDSEVSALKERQTQAGKPEQEEVLAEDQEQTTLEA